LEASEFSARCGLCVRGTVIAVFHLGERPTLSVEEIEIISLGIVVVIAASCIF